MKCVISWIGHFEDGPIRWRIWLKRLTLVLVCEVIGTVRSWLNSDKIFTVFQLAARLFQHLPLSFETILSFDLFPLFPETKQKSHEGFHSRQSPSWGYFSHLWSKSLNFFFVWKLLEKNEKWHYFCAHAQWWSPWRRKNVEKGHLTPSNLTFLLIAIDRNGSRRMKEEG